MHKSNIKKILFILSFIISLLLLPIFTRIILFDRINFTSIFYFPSILFTLSYILILLLLIYINKRTGKLIYIIFTSFFCLYSLSQIIHFDILDRIFTFSDIMAANQATNMLGYLIRRINISYIIILLLTILFIVISNKLLKNIKLKKTNIFVVILLVILIISTRSLAILSLGNNVDNNNWDYWLNEKNIYTNYSNPTRNYIVSGIYEYCFRDIYLYLKNLNNKDNDDDIKIINNYIDNKNYVLEDNIYTGYYKDKNLIMIMLESIDSWLLTEDVMPTLSYLKNNGLYFKNRYSPAFGGGYTINTEYASLTGMYAAIQDKPIYFYDKNNYDYSLPNLFRNNGYTVNSVHMNKKSFYNRENLHRALGFEHHYALSDMIDNIDFKYDTNIVKNNDSYNYIINKENKFYTFITTYSAHIPYINNYMCNNITFNKDNKNDDKETRCVKKLAHETDDFIKLLLQRLEEDNLLDDTVIVLYTDHYTYGYSDTSKQTNIKDFNLSQNTPFIIWSKDTKKDIIDTYNDTVDIPPTIFNMFDIDYNPNLYLGTDIFSKYHDDYVYFNNNTWLNKDIYFDGNNKEINEYIVDTSNKVNKSISINKKIITSDFYKHYKY